MSKRKDYPYWNKCQGCSKMFVPPNRQPHAKYCGSAKEKKGCSYANQLRLARQWAIDNPIRTREIGRKSIRHKRNINPSKFRGAYNV